MSTEPFEPARYLTRIGNADYLEVKWRLVWMRDRHPDATITTEMLEVSPEFALCKATVTIPGGGSATGHGSETPRDFRDHIEKAETKAIGRALAALGFGTQFSDDFAGSQRLVDAPVKRPVDKRDVDRAIDRAIASTPGTNGTAQPQVTGDGLPPPVLGLLPNEPVAAASRIRFLHGHGQQHQLDHDALKALAWPLYRVHHLEELSNRQVNDLVRRIAEGDLCTPVPPPSTGDPVERALRVPDPALT